MISVKVLNESGYDEAMLGLSLSYQAPADRMSAVALRLKDKNLGHNKFLRMMVVWLDVTGPRYWWQEADTYAVGTTKQSESTMHTLVKSIHAVDALNDLFEPGSLNPQTAMGLIQAADQNDVAAVKRLLPEGFLQRRIWMVNYQVLRNIIAQRSNHRLPHWKEFCTCVKAQVAHPEFLEIEND